jgi:hypothetical protein
MEMANLGVAFAACVTSFFGMNLMTGLEDHPFAFILVSLFITMASGLIGLLCFFRFIYPSVTRPIANQFALFVQ